VARFMPGGFTPEEGPKVPSESLASSENRNRFPRLSITSPVTIPPLQPIRLIKLLLLLELFVFIGSRMSDLQRHRSGKNAEGNKYR